jgi:hypothetical protein
MEPSAISATRPPVLSARQRFAAAQRAAAEAQRRLAEDVRPPSPPPPPPGQQQQQQQQRLDTPPRVRSHDDGARVLADEALPSPAHSLDATHPVGGESLGELPSGAHARESDTIGTLVANPSSDNQGPGSTDDYDHSGTGAAPELGTPPPSRRASSAWIVQQLGSQLGSRRGAAGAEAAGHLVRSLSEAWTPRRTVERVRAAAINEAFAAVDQSGAGYLTTADQLRDGLVAVDPQLTLSAEEADFLFSSIQAVARQQRVRMVGPVELRRYVLQECEHDFFRLGAAVERGEVRGDETVDDDDREVLPTYRAFLLGLVHHARVDSRGNPPAHPRRAEQSTETSLSAQPSPSFRPRRSREPLLDAGSEEEPASVGGDMVPDSPLVQSSQKIVSNWRDAKRNLAKLEATQTIIDGRLSSMKGKAKSMVFDELEQAIDQVRDTWQQLANDESEGADGPESHQIGSILSGLMQGKLPKVDRQIAIRAFFASVELEIGRVISLLVMLKTPVVLVCFIAVALTWQDINQCRDPFTLKARVFLLISGLLDGTVIAYHAVTLWKIRQYDNLEKKLNADLEAEAKLIEEEEKLREHQQQSEMSSTGVVIDTPGESPAETGSLGAARAEGSTPRPEHVSSKGANGSANTTELAEPCSTVLEQGSGQPMSLGGIVNVSIARGKFRQSQRRQRGKRIDLGLKINIGEKLLMTKAQARLQMGRKALRIYTLLYESNWQICHRIMCWSSLAWGFYGCYLILSQPIMMHGGAVDAANTDIDSKACGTDETHGGFLWVTVAVKLWLTTYFFYLLANVIQLGCSTVHMVIRHTQWGRRAVLRYAKQKELRDGLPVPLYTMLLNEWLLQKPVDEQTQQRLDEQYEKQEVELLKTRRVRLATELKQVGQQLERTQSMAALGARRSQHEGARSMEGSDDSATAPWDTPKVRRHLELDCEMGHANDASAGPITDKTLHAENAPTQP